MVGDDMKLSVKSCSTSTLWEQGWWGGGWWGRGGWGGGGWGRRGEGGGQVRLWGDAGLFRRWWIKIFKYIAEYISGEK